MNYYTHVYEPNESDYRNYHEIILTLDISIDTSERISIDSKGRERYEKENPYIEDAEVIEAKVRRVGKAKDRNSIPKNLDIGDVWRGKDGDLYYEYFREISKNSSIVRKALDDFYDRVDVSDVIEECFVDNDYDPSWDAGK